MDTHLKKPRVRLVRYNPKKHSEIILELLKSQNAEGWVQIAHLPRHGYVVFSGNLAVCCGFLRRVEGKVGQVDSFVSNGNIDSQTRHIALQLLVETIIKRAKTLKLRGIMAFSNDKSIQARAVETGFHVMHDFVIALPL